MLNRSTPRRTGSDPGAALAARLASGATAMLFFIKVRRLTAIWSVVFVLHHDAPGARDFAKRVLELNRGVRDVKLLGHQFLHRTQDGIAGGERQVLDHDVAAQGVAVRRQAPDVYVVNVDYARDLPHRADHRFEAQVARQALQQNVQRFLDDVPRRPQDQDPDQGREQRVNPVVSGPRDQEAAHNDARRRYRVAQHVDEGAANVDIVAARRAQAQHDTQVYDQAQRCHPDHDLLGHALGLVQAVKAFVKDEAGE